MLRYSLCIILLVKNQGYSLSKKPNILLIVADDLGWADVPWHDKTIYAPRLQDLAESGVILSNSYVQQVCTPSRAALLTGLYPYHLGRQHRALKPLRAGGIPTGFKMLPEMLKESGYSTHMIGKWHLGFCAWEYTPTRRGFDSFYGSYLGVLDHFSHVRDKYDGYDFHRNEELLFTAKGKYSTELYTNEAVNLISGRQNSSDRNPFFLYLPYQALHAPMQVPKQYADLVPKSVTNPSRRVYLAMLAAVDVSIGKIVDALKASNDYENTIIIFTTDNGGSVSHSASNAPLRGTKGTLWEGGTRGVAFIHSPLMPENGTVSNGLLHITDWAPTIASLAGVDDEDIDEFKLDGINQKDFILYGKPSKRNEFVYNIKTSPFKAGFRMGDYKLLWGEHAKGNWYTVNDKSRARKFKNKINWEAIQIKLMNNQNLVDLEENEWDLDDEKGTPSENPVEDFDELSKDQPAQLFDIIEDPEERNNIADENPEIVKLMKRKLRDASRTMRKGNFELKSVLGHPFLHGGNFMPGWCVPEEK